MREVWKDVKGYEGYYQVSNCGRVKSVDRVITFESKNASNAKIVKANHKSKILSPALSTCNKNPRYIVRLAKNGKYSTKTIGTLMAESFIPHNFTSPRLRYKDGNSFNLSLNNLEWTSRKIKGVNAVYGSEVRPVLKLSTNTVYCSVSEAMRQNKLSTTKIYKSLKSGNGDYQYV